MQVLRVMSAAEQVAQCLKQEIVAGTWTGTMPGGSALARQLGLGRMTVDAALDLLEREGLLESQGPRRRRKIVPPKNRPPSGMQVALLLYEPEDASNRYVFDMRHQLQASGHQLNIAPKSLTELKYDPKRVAAHVKEHPADAWIVMAGSMPVLNWFCQAGIPAFALFGRMTDLPVSGIGPDKLQAFRDTAQILTASGHRRIVMLVREERRKPKLGSTEETFPKELQARGVPTGPYNIPEWEESAEGLRACLDNLFHVTPPTAILVGDSMLVVAVQHYLLQRNPGMRDVALVCTDPNPAFRWCDPPVCHFAWDHQAIARQVVRWVGKVAAGKDDFHQYLKPAVLVEGNIRNIVPN